MRLIIRWIVFSLCVMCLSACGEPNPDRRPETKADDTLRIVSLAPHLTEMVYAVGAGDSLVGVVAYSDYPESALLLPVIGDAFRIDPERLAAVEPNLILAWEGGNPDELIGQLKSRGYNVAGLSSNKLIDVPKNIIEIGRLTGHADAAAKAAGQFLATIDRLALTHSDKPELKVFYQISLQPLYTVGGDHTISEMIALCGGRNLFIDLQQLAPVVSLEDVLSRNPDVIITGDDRAQLDQWSRWTDLSAVVNNNLFVVDAALVTRPGPRMMHGAEQICQHLTQSRLNQ